MIALQFPMRQQSPAALPINGSSSRSDRPFMQLNLASNQYPESSKKASLTDKDRLLSHAKLILTQPNDSQTRSVTFVQV